MGYTWIENRSTDTFFILLVIIITSIFYFHVIYRDGLTVGVDSPYYMIQVREIIRSGYMKYGDPPLMFYVLMIPTLFIRDIMLSFVYSVSILMVIAALPFYFFIKRFLKSSFAASISLLAILYSPTYIRMLGDFVKNQFGVIFIGLTMIYLFKDEKSYYDYLYIFIFTLLSGLTHILDLGIVILILISYLLYTLFLRNRDSIPIFLIISAVTSIFLVGYYISPFYFGDVGRGFNFVKSLINPLYTFHIYSIHLLNIPGNSGISRLPNLILRPFNQSIVIPVVAILTGGFILLIYSIRNKEFNKSCFLFSMVLLDFLLVFPWPSTWTFRFMLMTFLPTSLILGYIISLIKDKILLILISIIILSYPVSNTIMSINGMHPTISRIEYIDLNNMKNYVTSKGVVIFRERYKGYWVEYILDVDVVTRIESVKNYGRIYIILQNKMNPPPHTLLLYRGEVYSLYSRI